jgi:hypothetical protein
VRDDLAAIDVGLEEAEFHAVQRRQQGQRAVVHLLGRFSLRMRLPLHSPFCRCAIMKCAMSTPGDDSEPAGAGPQISNFFASPEP